MSAELSNLFHLARTALSGDSEKRGSRYHQRLWAAARFHELHPEVSSTAAYKKLDHDDAWRDVGSGGKRGGKRGGTRNPKTNLNRDEARAQAAVHDAAAERFSLLAGRGSSHGRDPAQDAALNHGAAAKLWREAHSALYPYAPIPRVIAKAEKLAAAAAEAENAYAAHRADIERIKAKFAALKRNPSSHPFDQAMADTLRSGHIVDAGTNRIVPHLGQGAQHYYDLEGAGGRTRMEYASDASYSLAKRVGGAAAARALLSAEQDAHSRAGGLRLVANPKRNRSSGGSGRVYTDADARRAMDAADAYRTGHLADVAAERRKRAIYEQRKTSKKVRRVLKVDAAGRTLVEVYDDEGKALRAATAMRGAVYVYVPGAGYAVYAPMKTNRGGRRVAPPRTVRRNPDEYPPLAPGDVLVVEKGNQRIGVSMYSKLRVLTAERLGADYGHNVRVVVSVSGYRAPSKAVNLYVRAEKTSTRKRFNMNQGDGINFISVRRA